MDTQPMLLLNVPNQQGQCTNSCPLQIVKHVRYEYRSMTNAVKCSFNVENCEEKIDTKPIIVNSTSAVVE